MSFQRDIYFSYSFLTCNMIFKLIFLQKDAKVSRRNTSTFFLVKLFTIRIFKEPVEKINLKKYIEVMFNLNLINLARYCLHK